jgi:hypothetical protein
MLKQRNSDLADRTAALETQGLERKVRSVRQSDLVFIMIS